MQNNSRRSDEVETVDGLPIFIVGLRRDAQNGNPFSTNLDEEELKNWVYLYGQNRDSDPLVRANFKVIQGRFEKECGPEDDIKEFDEEESDVERTGSGWSIQRFAHWGCGWVDHFLVDTRVKKALDLAVEIRQALQEYPVLDDDAYYQEIMDGIRETAAVSSPGDFWLDEDLDQYVLVLEDKRFVLLDRAWPEPECVQKWHLLNYVDLDDPEMRRHLKEYCDIDL